MRTEELSYTFPKNHDEINMYSSQFYSWYHNGDINGCVACVYGYFLHTETTTKIYAVNVTS